MVQGNGSCFWFEWLDTVYGIVTNYVEWLFLKSLNDKIERDMDTLNFEKQVTTVESLKRIDGKIYALLSEDWYMFLSGD